MVQSLPVRHLLPAAVGAVCVSGVTATGPLVHPTLATGLGVFPAAGLGVLAGLFYSATYDLLSSQISLPNLTKHAISFLTSGTAVYGIALAVSTAGWMVMPSAMALGAVITTAILVDIFCRWLFCPETVSNGWQKGLFRPWTGPSHTDPTQWRWPVHLEEIGVSPEAKELLDSFLKEVIPQIIASKQIPAFHRKEERFELFGKQWKLPRTLTFMADPQTQQLSAILLNVHKGAPLARGSQRTPKVCYNLTTGEKMVKKSPASPYEVDLLKTMNGTQGIEPLSYVRVVPCKNSASQEKSHLVTPYYEGGSFDQLLEKGPTFSKKQIWQILFSISTGLKKLHDQPGRTRFPSRNYPELQYRSSHLDLKPENLLYKMQGDSYELVISDFGSVNDLPNIWGTEGWDSPEKDWLMHRSGTEQEHIDFITRFGQKSDLWNVGLILTWLLLGSSRNALSLSSIEKPRFLTQDSVDSILDQCAARDPQKENGPFWALANQLLQVDPDKRMQDIVNELRKIDVS